jgi:hypothetical protein
LLCDIAAPTREDDVRVRLVKLKRGGFGSGAQVEGLNRSVRCLPRFGRRFA